MSRGLGDVYKRQIQEFGSDFAMRIWIDPAKMSQYKLTAPEIIGAIKSQNQQVAAGSIGTSPTDMKQSFQYIGTIKGRLTTEEEFGNIVVRANPDGSLIHLKDVAKVELDLSLIHISEPTRHTNASRMPSSA